MAAMLAGNDAIDLSVNWYGSLTEGPFQMGSQTGWDQGTLEGQVGYYHELWPEGPDLQMSVFGYKAHNAKSSHLEGEGYGGRVALASRDGMFRAFYQFENDRFHEEIHSVQLSLNVGFRLENLLALESPIEKPTPIFSSPRNLEAFERRGAQRTMAKHGTKSTPYWSCPKKCTSKWIRVCAEAMEDVYFNRYVNTNYEGYPWYATVWFWFLQDSQFNYSCGNCMSCIEFTYAHQDLCMQCWWKPYNRGTYGCWQVGSWRHYLSTSILGPGCDKHTVDLSNACKHNKP